MRPSVLSASIVVILLLVAAGACAPNPATNPTTSAEPLSTDAVALILPPSSPTPALPTVTTEPPTATSVPILQFRIMSYNILCGGGAPPIANGCMKYQGQYIRMGFDRLELVKKVVGAAKPDIVGFQEAEGWDSGSPAVIEEFAKSMGFKYWYQTLGEGRTGIDTAILSKFPIVATESLGYILDSSMLRAAIEMPDGRVIQVFVVHLKARQGRLARCELQKLAPIVASYLPGDVIFMGDMNMQKEGVSQFLSPLGLDIIAESRIIDQIWMNHLDSEMTGSKVVGDLNTQEANDVSDHLPVAVDIQIYGNSANMLTPAALFGTPTALPSFKFDYCP